MLRTQVEFGGVEVDSPFPAMMLFDQFDELVEQYFFPFEGSRVFRLHFGHLTIQHVSQLIEIGRQEIAKYFFFCLLYTSDAADEL